MTRLIDADALLNDVKDFPYGYRGMIKSIIGNQITIIPLPAEWQRPYTPFLCPVCGNYSDTRTRFCPHCGSKMMNAEENDSE